MASDPQDPVVLELAPLPREKLGPFLILGLEKDAGGPEIEAHWAKRVIWARKSQLRVPLEDVNWARQLVTDPDRRARADAASLNADTAERVIHQLERRTGGEGAVVGATTSWQPLDVEKDLAGYSPAVSMPSVEEVRGSLAAPEVPFAVPDALALVGELAAAPADPWSLPAAIERP